MSSPASKPTIAFVGVGRMGANMARRLKETGYTVTAVYDVHAPSAAELAKEIGDSLHLPVLDLCDTEPDEE